MNPDLPAFYTEILYVVCGAIMLLLGSAALRKDYKSLIHRSFFLFSVATVLWMVSLYAGFAYVMIDDHKAVLFFRLAFFFPVFIVTALALFFYSYPKITFKPSVSLKYILILGTLFLLIISLTGLVFESIVIENGVYVADELGSLYLVYTVLYQVYLLFIFFLIFKQIKNTSGNERKKVLISGIGFSVFWILVTSTNLVLPIFDIYIFQVEAVSFSLFFLIPTFYAMQKYRFFNLTSTSLNLMRIVLLVSSVGVTIFVINTGLDTFFPGRNNMFQDILILGVGSFTYIQLSKLFPELITASFRQFRNRLLELRTKLYTCNTYLELQKLLDHHFELQLNIPNAKVYLLRDKAIEIDIPVYTRDTFTNILITKDVLIAEELQLNKESVKTQKILFDTLQKLNTAVVIPLFAEGNLIGFFTLGPKEKDESYSQEEINELLKIKPNLEITFMNILLRNNLQEENDLMKEIVREKTHELKKQMAKVQNLLRQQSDFIAVAAHEFRTPLSIALFQLEDTIESYEHLPEVLSEMKTVEGSLDNLKELIQRLFTIQQYDLEKITLDTIEVDILDFLKKLFKELTPLMREKAFEFVFESTIKSKILLKIDQGQMRQVLHNLLTNASKFTPEKGKIILRVQSKKSHTLIQIADNGKGIPKEDQKRVFEKFQTTNVSKVMGIGLGLYLCKQIVELHKGKVWAEDTPGGGATFCVQLPNQAT